MPPQRLVDYLVSRLEDKDRNEFRVLLEELRDHVLNWDRAETTSNREKEYLVKGRSVLGARRDS